MNNKRRKEISKVIDTLTEISNTLSILAEEENEAFDNLPESLRDSSRSDDMQEWIDRLEGAQETIDGIIDELSS
jgi:formiminotetrahydrofolate cyclodeaminase